MKRIVAALLVAGSLGVANASSDAPVLARNAAQPFVTLPEGVRLPEGIAANPSTGEIYVGTFDFGPNANKLMRFRADGRLAAMRDFGGTPLLGLAYDAQHGQLYVANLGASQIQRIAGDFGASTPVEVVATIPGIGAPGPRSVDNPDGSADAIEFGSSFVPAPNGMTFDSRGNLYVSDSFQGAIFRIDDAARCALPCQPTLVAQDALLATAGFPPFGANGIALNAEETVLFVANTGDDRVLKLDLATGAATVFAESINGADGIAFDARGRLWVAANQGDEVVALNENGRVVARLGEFQGLRQGMPNGLLFPASIAIAGRELFVTNLALTLTGAEGDEPEEDVSRYTVSRMHLPGR